MTAFVLILAFPLVAGLGYGVFHLVARTLAAGRRPVHLARYTMVVYAVMLLVPLAAVWLSFPLALHDVGLVWPSPFGWPGWLAVLATSVVGIAVGVLLYRGEVWIQEVGRPASGHPTEVTEVSYLTDGHTREVVETAHHVPISVLLGTTTFVACAEEVLWRGYLIAFAMHSLSLSVGVALLLSALAFGINHYYFGLRNVAAKAIHGAVWGGLFILTGSLLAPVLSHLTFNLLALQIKVEWE